MTRATPVLLVVTFGLVLGFAQTPASAQETPPHKAAAAGETPVVRPIVEQISSRNCA